jgi:hypothetical protein
VPHAPNGLQLSYEFLLAHLDDMQRRCSVNAPEVIFDLDGRSGRRAGLLEANGYRIVFREDGEIVHGSRWLPGYPIPAGQFIAVRQDLSEGMNYPSVHFGP